MYSITSCACVTLLIIGIWQPGVFAVVVETRNGGIEVDPHLYFVEKYKETVVKISGWTNLDYRQEVEIIITAPNDSVERHKISTSSDGMFEIPLPLDYNSQLGTYIVSGRNQDGGSMGQLTFEVRQDPSAYSSINRQSPTPAQAISLAVETDSSKYNLGDQITISGKVITAHTDSYDNNVTVIIRTPNDSMLRVEQLIVDNGEFLIDVLTDKPLWKTDGTYTVEAHYMSTVAKADFEFLIPTQSPSTNNSPSPSLIADQTITTQDAFEHTVKATDGDGDKLTYALDNAPRRATINQSTGVIKWTPEANDVGRHDFTVSVSDGIQTSSVKFTVTVKTAPVQQPAQAQPAPGLPARSVSSGSVPVQQPAQAQPAQPPPQTGSEILIIVVLFLLLVVIAAFIKRYKRIQKEWRRMLMRGGTNFHMKQVNGRRGTAICAASFVVWVLSVVVFFSNDTLGFVIWGIACAVLVIGIGIYMHDKKEGERIAHEAQIRFGAERMDVMEGHEFEVLLKEIFEELGYKVTMTRATGDFGCDLLMKKDGKTISVQAKRHFNNVGNKAIQEVHASLNHYGADEGWVITNSGFTKAARTLADSTGVRLVDRDGLLGYITMAHKHMESSG